MAFFGCHHEIRPNITNQIVEPIAGIRESGLKNSVIKTKIKKMIASGTNVLGAITKKPSCM